MSRSREPAGELPFALADVCAPTRCLQRSLGDRFDRAPRPRARPGATRDRPIAERGGGLTDVADERYGIAVAPVPSGRCIKTLSSQRPNLKPTLSNVPTIRKPAARCSSIEPALAESPMTAIICL